MAQTLFEAGLIRSPHLESFADFEEKTADGNISDSTLRLETDVSGYEWVSSILRDDDATWSKLEELHQILSSHGAQWSWNTGTHINFDTFDFKREPKFFEYLIMFIKKYQPILYRLGGPVFELPNQQSDFSGRPTLIGRKPITIAPKSYASIADFKHSFPGKDNAVNARGESDDDASRVEIRIPRGFNPEALRIQHKIYAAMIQKIVDAIDAEPSPDFLSDLQTSKPVGHTRLVSGSLEEEFNLLKIYSPMIATRLRWRDYSQRRNGIREMSTRYPRV